MIAKLRSLQLMMAVLLVIVRAALTVSAQDGNSKKQLVYTLNENGDRVGVYYSGNPDWLTNQKEPESRLDQVSTLRHIEINNCDVTARELQYIKSLGSVKSLKLGDLEQEIVLEGASLDVLRGMHQLEALEINEKGLQPKHFRFLRELPLLRVFTIGYEADDEHIEILLDCRSLRELKISGDISDRCATTILKMSSLNSLDVSSDKITDSFVEKIADSPNIRRLVLRSKKLTSRAIDILANMSQLESIDLGIRMTGASLEKLCKLQNLRDLSIVFAEDPLDSFKDIARLPKLEHVSISGFTLSKSQWQVLNRLTSLERIQLWDSELDMDSIRILQNLPAIRYVLTSSRTSSHVLDLAKLLLPRVEFSQ